MLSNAMFMYCCICSSDLTWRDVQYLIAYTSNRDKLVEGEWFTNGGGLRVSPKFGFGAVDAEAMVTRARRWINVPSQQTSLVFPSSTSRYDVINCKFKWLVHRLTAD